MNKSQIEKYIPKALEAIEEFGFRNQDSGIIPNEYKGYIASFGASIVTNGLLPAIAFFQKQGDAKASKKKITDSILFLIKDENTTTTTTLLQYTVARIDKKSKIRQEIVAASIALKLAMRTFQFSTDQENEND